MDDAHWQRIILVRHGRSAHVQRRFLNVAEFGRWREEYDAAGIDHRQPPPQTLKALAAGSGVIVASAARRAVESAKLLDAKREITISPLLQEREVVPPRIPWIRMPLIGWALAYGVQWVVRATLRHPHAPTIEVDRGREAAEWLSDLAERHGSVLAVTHASFRSLVLKQLIIRGWRCDARTGGSGHWSAAIVSRRPSL